MKQIFAGVLALVIALCLLPCAVFAADSVDASTEVKLKILGVEITGITENCAIGVNSDLTLQVAATGILPFTFRWELSADGGTTWNDAPGAANAETYNITHAQENTPAATPFIYRVTVRDGRGYSASAQTRVLVSNDYDYRSIALRNGDTEVASYMHEKTRLVVKPLPDSAPAATELESRLAEDCLPLVLYDVSLVNQNDEVVPYFGNVEVSFHVGSEYDGRTLRVFHFHDNRVSVYSGVVTGGVLTVTVTGLSPFMVEIPAANTRTVAVNAGAGGTVTPSGKVNLPDGADKTFTLLPDAGYEVSAVTVDAAPVSVTGNSFTLSNIIQNKTVSVSFRRVTPAETLHTVSINAPAHGTVQPSGTIQVRHGSAQTIYFYPDAGHELDTVTVNGAAVNVVGNSYTLSALSGDAEVVASFRSGTAQPPDVYKTISASAGANGSISPMGDVSVEYGGDMYFYFIPNIGYEVDKLLVDGVATTAGESYHFVNVIDAHTISVSYKKSATPPPQTYHSITASAGAHGSISPSGSVSVAYGGSQTFSFIPDAGYELDKVTVDGAAVSAPGSSYRFTSVTADHTIKATFKRSAATPYYTYAKYYTISALSDENGAISPAGNVRIAEGRSAYFYFLPDEGFEVDTVRVDGSAIAAAKGSYYFENVYSAHSIYVTFKKTAPVPESTVYYSVTALAEGGGSISPSGEVQVAEGGSQTFYLIADEGCEVEAVYVNGEKQSVAGGRFTVERVTGDTELRVIFTPVSALTESGGSHCFICGLLKRDISPWCWLLPLIAAVVFGGALWLSSRKRGK